MSPQNTCCVGREGLVYITDFDQIPSTMPKTGYLKEPFWLSSLLLLIDDVKLILLRMDDDVEEKMPWSLGLCMEPCV